MSARSTVGCHAELLIHVLVVSGIEDGADELLAGKDPTRLPRDPQIFRSSSDRPCGSEKNGRDLYRGPTAFDQIQQQLVFTL